MQTHSQYQAQALRLEKIIFVLESILVYIAALFTSILLPSLLMQYVFSTANLLEVPKVIEYIPVTAFLVATLYFVYATATIIAKASKIKTLDKNMVDGGCDCCADLNELKELEALAEKTIKAAKPAKKKAAKKTTKKK